MHRDNNENADSFIPKPLRNGNPRGNPKIAPRCGAKTRVGLSCQAPALRGKQRCRMHGGHSTGAPRGGKHGMYKHGRYTHEAIAERMSLRALLKQCHNLTREVEELV